MTSDDHISAPTKFAEANGIRYAYRRFGAASGIPLLFLQHWRGGMDHWDPAVTDGLAAGRPVVLFDNAGVAASSGQTPETMEGFADNAAAFAGALGLTYVDVLGFSIGGHAAQALALRHPRLVRRLVIVGSKPRAGVDEGTHPDVLEVGSRRFIYQGPRYAQGAVIGQPIRRTPLGSSRRCQHSQRQCATVRSG
jgi:pimeloyl-ACP methyl ester carboxylesterase